jgi:hypothetical protein
VKTQKTPMSTKQVITFVTSDVSKLTEARAILSDVVDVSWDSIRSYLSFMLDPMGRTRLGRISGLTRDSGNCEMPTGSGETTESGYYRGH